MSNQFYPLSPNGIFSTIQGEGVLLGVPMIFIRLAGCSIGCEHCDTDYRVHEKVSVTEIVHKVASLLSAHTQWLWITGGEPTDHDLLPLLLGLRRITYHKTALATSGHKEIDRRPFDFVSVSPHDPAKWVQKSGDELKLVSGLDSHRLHDFLPCVGTVQEDFKHLFVCPCWDDRIEAYDKQSVEECVQWVNLRPEWRVGCQAHRLWRLP